MRNVSELGHLLVSFYDETLAVSYACKPRIHSSATSFKTIFLKIGGDFCINPIYGKDLIDIFLLLIVHHLYR